MNNDSNNITPIENAPLQIAATDDKWQLTWNDEFNGTGDVDETKWEQCEYLRKPNDNGSDGYWDADYVQLDGIGNLDIFVDEIPNANGDSDTNDYAVGMIRSKDKFSQTYGLFEARCKLPEQAGWWVAFWLFPNNGTEPAGGAFGTGADGTEIDIMEGWGWTDSIQSALHYDGYGDKHVSTGSGKIQVAGLDEGYHIFSLVWTAEKYIFYVDGVETWRVSGVPDPKADVVGEEWISHAPSYVKLTGEISTEAWTQTSGWANPIPAEGYSPDHFLVDWVRVYKYQN